MRGSKFITLLMTTMMLMAWSAEAKNKNAMKPATDQPADSKDKSANTPDSGANYGVWSHTDCADGQAGQLPSYRDKKPVFTYVLKASPAGATSSQPFYLLPMSATPPVLYAGEVLTIRIIANDDAVESRVPLLSINTALVQATPLNPTPLRPSITQTADKELVKLNLGKIVPLNENTWYFCASKVLTADVIPTITVSAIVDTTTKTTDKPIPAGLENFTNPLTINPDPLPQVHSLSRFNIATGLIASSLNNHTFTRVETAAAVPPPPGSPSGTQGTPAQFKTVDKRGDPTVLPALFFTAYAFRPIDAESKFERWDLLPQPSIGFSISSPSSDFFFGGSSELFLRNVQIVYGMHYGQTTHLAPIAFDDPSVSTVQTQQRFERGLFAGLTFNVDFIKDLFKK